MRHHIEEHLEDGKIRVTADERHYLHPVTKQWHRSVTGITGLYPAPGLMPWAVNSFNTYADHMAYLDEAAGQGTETHAVLELGGVVKYDQRYKDIWHYLVGARNFFQMFKPRVLRREFTVWGEVGSIRWAGTVDAEMEIDKGLLDGYLSNRRRAPEPSGELVPVIIDYKTSNNLWRKHDLQMAAYWSAGSEDFHGHRALILQLGTRHKTGFYLHQVDAVEFDVSVFHHLCHIHKDAFPDDDPKSWLVEGTLNFEQEVAA